MRRDRADNAKTLPTCARLFISSSMEGWRAAKIVKKYDKESGEELPVDKSEFNTICDIYQVDIPGVGLR